MWTSPWRRIYVDVWARLHPYDTTHSKGHLMERTDLGGMNLLAHNSRQLLAFTLLLSFACTGHLAHILCGGSKRCLSTH